MRVLSGTVTSSTKTAASLQEGVGVGSSGFSVGEAVGGISVGSFKPGRVGGHQPSIDLHDLCAVNGLPVWHGGMLESGIGRAHNIHLASLPNFRLPGDIAASRRYFVPDLIEPPIDVASDGTVAVPDGPGIGVVPVIERVRAATVHTERFRP